MRYLILVWISIGNPRSIVDRIKDFKKVAKIADPYTENKEFYKNLKTNQNSKFFIS